MAYDKLEAGGQYRLLLQIALLCWMVATALAKKGHKPKLEDFLVVPMDKPDPPTAQEVWRKFKSIARTMNARNNGNDNRGSQCSA